MGKRIRILLFAFTQIEKIKIKPTCLYSTFSYETSHDYNTISFR